MSNEKIIEAIEIVGEYGMHSSIFLIIGFPHEGRQDVFETIKLMAAAKPGPIPLDVFLSVSRNKGASNQPGWRIYKLAENEGTEKLYR